MKHFRYSWSLMAMVLLLVACRKLPEKKDYLSNNANFNKKLVYEPTLGRTQLELTNFNADGSTYPLHFSIENARSIKDGKTATELFEPVKVQEWLRDYDGKEKSIEEIEAKRVWVQKPFLEVRAGSGDLIFRNASSEKLRTYPDSGYRFDIKIQNLGNEKIIKDFWLRPLKEVPYEPYEYNIYSGERMQENRVDKDGKTYRVPYVIHPSSLSAMYFHKDSLLVDTLVSVYIQKTGTKANTVTFKFMDSRLNPINPDKFSGTKWDSVVHGFNMIKTAAEVKYQVAYPLPLTKLNTKFATDGKARSRFIYSRKGFGGRRLDAVLALNYAIHEPGEWTIIFFFQKDPLFEDD